MKISSISKFVHTNSFKYLHKHAIVVDATVGNGHDALYILQNLPIGTVYAFDIQKEAIDNAKIKCSKYYNIEYILDSHSNIDKYITRNIDLAIYNLGYLPNSTSEISTSAFSTIISVEKTLLLLKQSGAIIITIYTGHDNHLEEKGLINYIETLSTFEYIICKYQMLNKVDAPYVVIIEKR